MKLLVALLLFASALAFTLLPQDPLAQDVLDFNDLSLDSRSNILTTGQGVRGLPGRLVAGEVHFSRIPVEYWDHRLRMIKSMGFNSLSVYIMWNYHEVERGVFDYATGNKNLTKFLELAKQYDLYVLIRPGPYVCAEWDFGGFPARLLAINNIKLRANNQIYLKEVEVYFRSLAPLLNPYLAKNGGPIVLLQIENEYGFYGSDKTYIEALRTMWRDIGVECDEYYVDTVSNLNKCHWSGANIGINDGNTEEQYVYARTLEKTGLIFGGEIYSGWLTHWGEAFQGKNMSKYMQEFEFLLSKNHSFSMYMVHGGSNFALTAGANAYTGVFDYRGHITSYDYDAPINEMGTPNDKFTNFRELAKKYLDWTIPEPPQPVPALQTIPIKLMRTASLFANLPAPAFSKVSTPYLFETNELKMFNQGFVLYETQLNTNTHFLKLVVRDFAVVYLDDKFVGSLDRSVATQHELTLVCSAPSCRLSILVEAMGHINFDHQMETDRKGLFFFNDTRATKFLWDIYKINVDENILAWRHLDNARPFPSLAMGSFTVNAIGDTFINVSSYKKGYIWVNGHNLGRYWNIGPSQKVYCPGVWLKRGDNSIHILELLTEQTFDVRGEATLK